MARQIISAKIDVDRLARLDATATDLGMSRTAAIEAALDAWLVPLGPILAEDAEPFTLDGEPSACDPDQALLDLAAEPPSNPWGI